MMNEQHSTLMAPEPQLGLNAPNADMMAPIIAGASILGLLLGTAFILFFRSKRRDFASCSAASLALGIIFFIAALVHYERMAAIPVTGWMYGVFGIPLCLAAYRQRNHAQHLPTLSVSQTWIVSGLSVALNQLCGVFSLPTIFIAGLFYRLEMAPCLISYFTLGLVSILIRMYTALQPIALLFSVTYSPYYLGFTIGMASTTAGAMILSWWLYDRFQWRFLNFVGWIHIIIGFGVVYYS